MKTYINKTSVVILLAVFSLFFTGCVSSSGGNYGRMVWDDTVKENFENFEVMPGYSYYYYGTDTFPRVLVGLKENYEMDSTLWRPITFDSKQLHNWIWGHANRREGDVNRYGKVIKDPSGNSIGIWYAMNSWRLWARVQVDADNKVKVSRPIGDLNRPKRLRGLSAGDF